MKKHNKKIIIILAILLCVTGIVIVITATPLKAIIFPLDLWKSSGGVTDFEKYQKDYEVAANIAYDYYLENPREGIRFSMGKSSDGGYFYWAREVNQTWTKFSLTDEEQESLRNIREFSFLTTGGKNFNGIRVYKNQVVFRTLDGGYALIYSVDGTKPKFVNYPDERGRTHYEKLTDHWYNGYSGGE